MNTRLQKWTEPDRLRILLMTGLAGLTLVSVFGALYLKMNLLLGVPLAALVMMQVVYDYRPLYYLMIMAIPVSIQVELPGGSALDFFSELFMLLFLAIFIFNVLAGRQFSSKTRIYAFHIIIFLLLFWTLFTAITSEYPTRSFKYLLSRIWYMAAFVFMAEKIIREPRNIRMILWCFMIPLVGLTIVISIQHGMKGFSFEAAHSIPFPFFANHVVYGCATALFLPFAWFMKDWYTPKSIAWYVVMASIAMITIAAILSFARGAWVSLVIIVMVGFAIKYRIFPQMAYAALIVLALGLGYLINDNTFYKFAPEYKKTIFHEGDLEGHLTATFEGKEMSGMERFYRWVAAKNMVAAAPMIGFGPSTFNQVYQRYADDAFRTYVSDNPEQSTTHNYFLMTFTEQGVLGGLLFIFLCVFMMIKGARLYHRISDPVHKHIVMASVMALTVIVFHSILNELIEVDKVGAMFWLCLVFIHKVEVWNDQNPKVSETETPLVS